MTANDAALGFGDLAKSIRDDDTQSSFPDVDDFINSQNIQLSPDIRESWTAAPLSQKVELEELKTIFKNNSANVESKEHMEKALSCIRAFLAETKHIPDLLERADEALSSISGSREKLAQLIASTENGMPK
ncbi:hypothetical protein BDB00DRAFT_809164 [Zychaea mexicana]|uniref:uncharacterized protein n=1 Tax=Zychaea mexicana TaxID=64656 RepID=UPI0022FEE385|nr:uncharacterized protein BDB00DRAFT_809164 [Zychaea mexicana]KAI9496514.1 hypothetical protein BDB00DRAFT_809164 [Zychaea mexicana]